MPCSAAISLGTSSLYVDIQHSRSLVKEGWTRPQEKCREASLLGADGVVRSTTDNRWLDQPPVCASQLWLREVFLIAQPPLLVQGGELPVLSLKGSFYSGESPFTSRGERMNTPPGEIAYRNVLCVAPFNRTGIGFPVLSKMSIRPALNEDPVFTSSIAEAQPPPIAN